MRSFERQFKLTIINLKELKEAVYLYGTDTNYDNSYREICKIQNIDLYIPKHVETLLIWLRSWGCRQFKKTDESLSIYNIQEWYSRYDKLLPDRFDRLLSFVPEAEEYFDYLTNKTASLKYRNNKVINVSIGPVGAAKILFAIRPNVFPPWDNNICEKLEYQMTGEGYVKYLQDIRSHLLILDKECKSLNLSIDDLPKIVNREMSSLPKLIDEFHWITLR